MPPHWTDHRARPNHPVRCLLRTALVLQSILMPGRLKQSALLANPMRDGTGLKRAGHRSTASGIIHDKPPMHDSSMVLSAVAARRPQGLANGVDRRLDDPDTAVLAHARRCRRMAMHCQAPLPGRRYAPPSHPARMPPFAQ